MGSVTAAEMRELEDRAFRAGATPGGLMELAGIGLGRALLRWFPRPGTAVAYLGKGHNAGDALVALKVLRAVGWQVAVRAAFPAIEWASLTREKFREAGDPAWLEQVPDAEAAARPLVLLDGLLGIGAKGALREPLAELAGEMERLRQERGAKVVAVDVPSGIDCDDGTVFPGAVRAEVTFTIGVPKRGLLAARAVDAVGALALIPLEALPVPAGGDCRMISPVTLDAGRSPRLFEFHKGMAGRVSLLAGSALYPGAAVLAATGALRGGAGLVTLHVPESAAAVIAAKCPPEVMVRPIRRPEELASFHADAWVCGPGLGETDELSRAALDGILRSGLPCVVDADALNSLARSGDQAVLSSCHVLTPHPGEFARLAPELAERPREEAAAAFVERCGSVLLLKGARTLVTRRGGALWRNPTGTPGMASGGQGDALAGVIGALLAGGTDSLAAAAMGAWLCGRASERALLAGASEESLLASDTLAHLGGAFRDWREGVR